MAAIVFGFDYAGVVDSGRLEAKELAGWKPCANVSQEQLQIKDKHFSNFNVDMCLRTMTHL